MVAGLPLCFAGVAAAEDASKLEDALAEPVSLKFERTTLEESLHALTQKVRAEHPSFVIKVVGDDLKFEGITRNQTIRDYEATDKPAAEILTDLVLRGDPSVGTKDSRDPELRLIWIVAANPDNAEKLAILITTRAAARKRGDKLPKVFHPKDQ
jgi:hypothetical protein